MIALFKNAYWFAMIEEMAEINDPSFSSSEASIQKGNVCC